MDRPPTAPADSPLGRLLLEEITPVVMVLSTPLAEEACRKNRLDLVGMLRPFCSFQNIDVPVRTASDQPYRLQEFGLRMVYASDVRQMSHDVRTKRFPLRPGELSALLSCSSPSPSPPLFSVKTVWNHIEVTSIDLPQKSVIPEETEFTK